MRVVRGSSGGVSPHAVSPHAVSPPPLPPALGNDDSQIVGQQCSCLTSPHASIFLSATPTDPEEQQWGGGGEWTPAGDQHLQSSARPGLAWPGPARPLLFIAASVLAAGLVAQVSLGLLCRPGVCFSSFHTNAWKHTRDKDARQMKAAE